MKKLLSFATNHPVLFVLGALITWLAIWILFLATAAGALGRPYSESVPMTLSRLATILCLLLLLWRMGWLKDAGIIQLGSWRIWLIALAGIGYIIPTSLYSFFGKATLNASALLQNPAALTNIMENFVVAVNEEIFFRGLVLLVLLRAWGARKWGLIGSVLLTSLIFSLPHLVQVFSGGIPTGAAPLLILQTLAVSIWWGALVASGGSIWPAVLAHFIGNSVITLQALTATVIEPVSMSYQRLLLFSLPLGVLGLCLLFSSSKKLKAAREI